MCRGENPPGHNFLLCRLHPIYLFTFNVIWPVNSAQHKPQHKPAFSYIMYCLKVDVKFIIAIIIDFLFNRSHAFLFGLIVPSIIGRAAALNKKVSCLYVHSYSNPHCYLFFIKYKQFFFLFGVFLRDFYQLD